MDVRSLRRSWRTEREQGRLQGGTSLEPGRESEYTRRSKGSPARPSPAADHDGRRARAQLAALSRPGTQSTRLFGEAGRTRTESRHSSQATPAHPADAGFPAKTAS